MVFLDLLEVCACFYLLDVAGVVIDKLIDTNNAMVLSCFILTLWVLEKQTQQPIGSFRQSGSRQTRFNDSSACNPPFSQINLLVI